MTLIPLLAAGAAVGAAVVATSNLHKRRLLIDALASDMSVYPIPVDPRHHKDIRYGESRHAHQVRWAKVRSTLSAMDQAYQRFFKQRVDPLFGGVRQQQMTEMNVAGGELAMADYEQTLNRNIGFGFVIVGTALVAGQAMAPIALICFPLALYISRQTFIYAYNSLVHKRRITLPVMASANILASWLGGFYVVSGLSYVFYFLQRS